MLHQQNLFQRSRLSGKCNWLKIPKVDRYDRVDFVCPTFKINRRNEQELMQEKMEWNEHIENGTLDSL